MSEAALLQGLLEYLGGFPEKEAAKAAEAGKAWITNRGHGGWVDRLFGWCESPMERTFLIGLLYPDLGVRLEQDDNDTEENGGAGCCCLLRRTAHDLPYRLELQREEYCREHEDAGPFARVDVTVFGCDGRTVVAIEIDGHEFHEKTKEQAANDKQRDRRLAALGRLVLRFTGSEVYADPKACWREVFAVLDAAEDRLQHSVEIIRERLLEEMTAPPQLPAPAESKEVAAE